MTVYMTFCIVLTADITVMADHQPRDRHVTRANLSRVAISTDQNINNNILPRGNLRIATYNAQSLGPEEKRIAVTEFIRDSNLDILFIQETWFKPKGDEGKVSSLPPAGYSVKSWPRDHRGGGMAIVFRNSLSKHLGFVSNFNFSHVTFEIIVTTFSFKKNTINMACLYRT